MQEGKYGVFLHSSWNNGDARYLPGQVIKLFERESAADKLAATDPRYVVRWVVSV